jgi:uncharacterized membrane protein required for colicin V production
MLEREARRKYFFELGGAMLLYFATVVASVRIGRTMPEGIARTMLLLAPVIPLALSIWAIVRQFGRMDEFVRLRTLESFSIAGAITAGLTFSYGFLESAGFPRQSMFWVWGIMGLSWGTVHCVRCWVRR